MAVASARNTVKFTWQRSNLWSQILVRASTGSRELLHGYSNNTLLTKHANMNSYGFCFAACPCITQQTGAAFCTKGSGTSCTNWLRRNDKLSDVAHWKSWAFSTIALPTLQKEWRWGYPLGLFPNPRESFTVTPVNASRLQQLKVAITGKRTPYEDLFIPANNQEYHFLAKGIYWNQHFTFLSFTGNSPCSVLPYTTHSRKIWYSSCIFVMQKLVSWP